MYRVVNRVYGCCPVAEAADQADREDEMEEETMVQIISAQSNGLLRLAKRLSWREAMCHGYVEPLGSILE